MDAFLLPLLAAALAEIGDKTMLLTVVLAVRFRRPGAVFGGAAAAAIANAAIAAAGGAAVATLVGHRAIYLMLALALLAAAAGSLRAAKAPDPLEGWRLGPFLTAAAGLFILEFGDKTQFLTFAFAAHDGAPVLTALGAAIGVILTGATAIVLGCGVRRLRPFRFAAAGLLGVCGLVAGLGALQLI